MVNWAGVCVVLALPVMAGLGGCVKDTAFAPSSAPRYMTVRQSDVFQYGPMQPGRPDEIPSHTIVKVTTLEPEGYSRIVMSDGSSGYIATDNLKLAPPMARAVSAAKLFPEDNYAALAHVNTPQVDFNAPVDILPTNVKPADSGSDTNGH